MSLHAKKRVIQRYVILFITMQIVLGCEQQRESLASDYSAEIQNLTSNDLKREYLEAIFKIDQQVRSPEEESTIIFTYDRDSEDHLFKMKETDAINLNKVEAYLAFYGHPSKKDLGEIAALTPWVVVHHSRDYQSRLVNFMYLYKGYLNMDIKESSFSMYLARMYQIKNGERLDMGGPYKEKDKITRLINELDLEID